MKKLGSFCRTAKFHDYRKNVKKDNAKISPGYQKACEIRSSGRWLKLRDFIMQKYSGMCMYCFNAPAVHVHHIKPLSVFTELAFDEDNLAPLCKKCHGFIHVRAGRGEDAESQLREKMKENIKKLKGE